MPRTTIDDTLAEGEQIARVWTDNPTFTLGEITLPQLQTMLTDLRATGTEIETLRTRLTALINDANSKIREVNAVVTRARSGFRATYGPNSTQYEQAGGTRTDERKPRKSSKG